MSKLEKQFLRITYMDELALKKTHVHRLHPVAKLVTTFIFMAVVVSFDKYSLTGLYPFFIFPVVLIAFADLPYSYLLKTLLAVSPFALMIGLANIFVDTQSVGQYFGITVTGGLVSFCTIMIKFVLTVLGVLILISSTGFYNVCAALEKLYIPKVFVTQLMFLYRYIFVLVEEAGRMLMAKELRSSGVKTGIRTYSSLIGQLLLRTLDRAQMIHQAMYSRGFDGNIRSGRIEKFSLNDGLFVILWAGIFVILKKYDFSVMIGDTLMRLFA